VGGSGLDRLPERSEWSMSLTTSLEERKPGKAHRGSKVRERQIQERCRRNHRLYAGEGRWNEACTCHMSPVEARSAEKNFFEGAKKNPAVAG